MPLKYFLFHFRSELTCIQISLSFAVVFVISQPAITRKDPALVMNNDHYLFQVPPCPQTTPIMADAHLLKLHEGNKTYEINTRKCTRKSTCPEVYSR